MDDFREGLPDLGPKWLNRLSLWLAIVFGFAFGWALCDLVAAWPIG